ncbi:MAG: FG-GAP-like repeat-containing protein [Phycisphaerales bacterium]|nr:FG-GAP-like repeat-containing protein [Phycisphaerales bacterium]
MLKSTLAILLTANLCGVVSAQWVEFAQETSARLQADGSVGANDTEEKDYAVGDIDNDGDEDLICARKEPFTSTGRGINILFMNENGVLVDRTQMYATASNVSGDQGFLTPTNDRDVKMADLNGDGWLDVVTAVTLTDGAPRHLSHPRVYINLGEEDGQWLGLRFEDGRIPEMHASGGPRFCSVVAGDIDNDGDLDLYFGDYDSGTTQIFDYNNRLLINDGNGWFTDESTQRMNSEMLLSAFGAASEMWDVNEDGALDVIKQTSLNPPQHIAITYNNPSNPGWFNGYQIVDQLAPYFVTTGDLNGDGRLDLVVVDDGIDSYYLNQGNNSAGQVNWSMRTFASATSGFGGDAYITDLDRDGNPDVIITDVDVDIPGCSRTTHILRNNGDGPDVTFSSPATGFPGSALTGWHDVGIIDINGDGWDDLVVGRCSSTEVWMNQPPIGLVFYWETGIPGFVTPEEPTEVILRPEGFGGEMLDADSLSFHTRIEGGDWASMPVKAIGDGRFATSIPAVACVERVEFYAMAEGTSGTEYRDPPSGGAEPYRAIAADGQAQLLRDDMEEDTDGWMVVNDASLETGAWERVDPLGTLYGSTPSQPEDDATAGSDAVRCWITQNGTVGGSVGEADVDGGPTSLLSPMLDLSVGDGTVTYMRWMYDSELFDTLKTYVSNDEGNSWTFVHETGGTQSMWESASFVVSEYVEPTSTVRVAWVIQDADSPSVVEAGIDNLQVDSFVCDKAEPCPGDIDQDGEVSVEDILVMLASWGDTGGAPADINGDGVVDVNDLLILLSGWGPC